MAKPAPQPQVPHSVAEKLGAGRTVYMPAPHEAVGYGDAQDGADTSPVRAKHFWWPGPLRPDDGIVIGELTEEQREAVERKATEDLLALAGDAPTLMWRCLPQWETERLFDRRETHHRFYLRGAFVWDGAA